MQSWATWTCNAHQQPDTAFDCSVVRMYYLSRNFTIGLRQHCINLMATVKTDKSPQLLISCHELWLILKAVVKNCPSKPKTTQAVCWHISTGIDTENQC